MLPAMLPAMKEPSKGQRKRVGLVQSFFQSNAAARVAFLNHTRTHHDIFMHHQWNAERKRCCVSTDHTYVSKYQSNIDDDLILRLLVNMIHATLRLPSDRSLLVHESSVLLSDVPLHPPSWEWVRGLKGPTDPWSPSVHD